MTSSMLVASLLLLQGAAAWAPVAPMCSRVSFSSRVHTPSRLAMSFEETVEEEVERLLEKEMGKTRKMSKMQTDKGMEYAPWLKVGEKDEQQMRQLLKEKVEARRRRAAQEEDVKGSLLMDSQAQELSGSGLRFKVIDDNSVELEFSTDYETPGTRGFVIKRRAAKTSEFEVLASYESYGPLVSKGEDGGTYRFLDEDLPPGGWFYRVTECDDMGDESDLSQCLVEIQTAEEQQATVIAVAGFVALAVLAVVGGLLADPMQ